MAKILVVEDHVETLQALRSLLESDRHVVDCVATADDGVEFIKSFPYDALVVDWEMPGMSGVEFVRLYRSTGGLSPVLMLTGKSTTPDKVSGLDSGADYYLTKPFVGDELLSFIRAALRRKKAPEARIVSFRNLDLNVEGATAKVEDATITLSGKELALLQLLMENSKRIVSHDEVRIAGWPDDPDVSSGTVRVFLTGIREKLQLLGADIKIISVRGHGYRIE